MQKIVTIIARILNCHYLQAIIGRTHVKYLLLYLAGLLILDKNHSQEGMAERLGLCSHDGLNRLLRRMNFPARTFESLLINYIERYREGRGWVIIDDTAITKRFSSKIAFTDYCWCSSLGRVAMGMHVVTLYWTDGERRFPVGYRLWRPRKKVGPENYRTKLELAQELVTEHLDFCLGCECLVFDAWYCSKKFLNAMSQVGIKCVSSLMCNRNVSFHERELKVKDLALGFSDVVDLPGFGPVRVLCTKIGKREHCLVSTDDSISPETVRLRYKRRWPVEMFFRADKQYLGLENCQCRSERAVENHIKLVFLGYVVLEVIRESSGLSHGAIKRALQKKFHEHGLSKKMLHALAKAEKAALNDALKHAA